MNYIEIIKDFVDKYSDNEEFMIFMDGYIEALMGKANAMYWNMSEKSIPIVEDLFAQLYKGHEDFYHIQEWHPEYNREEYEIVWFSTLEEKDAFYEKRGLNKEEE